MSIRLQTVFSDLAARDVTPNDLTADEIVTLVHACERVDNPFSALRADLCARPIWAGHGVWLFPPTAGATVWLSEFAHQWWGDKSWLGRWATIYALANGRKEDAFTYDKWKMRSRVLRFALRLCLHQRELMQAVSECYGIDEHEMPELPGRKRTPSPVAVSAANEFVKIVARLEVGSGISKNEWLWGRSVTELSRAYVAQSELAAAAFGGLNNEATQELDAAIQNLARVVAHITRRIREERAKQ